MKKLFIFISFFLGTLLLSNSNTNNTNNTTKNKIAKCKEKRYCKQMTSCEEAMFYFKECGLKKLDKDGDGKPCENVCK